MRGRRGHRSGDRGTASLELVALSPFILLFALVALQVGALLWAVTTVDEAVRQGARAQSLGQSGCAAVRGALPGTLTLSTCTQSSGVGGPGDGPHQVQVEVDAPILPGIASLVPDATITRDAVMP